MITIGRAAAVLVAAASMAAGAIYVQAQSTIYMARQHLHSDKDAESKPATEDPNVAKPADTSKA